MGTPTLTLDTNLLQEYWKQRDKVQFVEQLLDLAQQGKVDLAVTARVRTNGTWSCFLNSSPSAPWLKPPHSFLIRVRIFPSTSSTTSSGAVDSRFAFRTRQSKLLT